MAGIRQGIDDPRGHVACRLISSRNSYFAGSYWSENPYPLRSFFCCLRQRDVQFEDPDLNGGIIHAVEPEARGGILSRGDAENGRSTALAEAGGKDQKITEPDGAVLIQIKPRFIPRIVLT